MVCAATTRLTAVMCGNRSVVGRCGSGFVVALRSGGMIEFYAVVWCGDAVCLILFFFFFSSRRRHTRFDCDWSSDVCSSDLGNLVDPCSAHAAESHQPDAALWFQLHDHEMTTAPPGILWNPVIAASRDHCQRLMNAVLKAPSPLRRAQRMPSAPTQRAFGMGNVSRRRILPSQRSTSRRCVVRPIGVVRYRTSAVCA